MASGYRSCPWPCAPPEACWPTCGTHNPSTLMPACPSRCPASFTAAMPWFWVTPSLEDWLIFIMVGAFGAGAQYAFLIGYRYAPATVLAPFDYTQILFALAIGYLAWGETPTEQAFIGGAIIVASGLFIWWREQRLARG